MDKLFNIPYQRTMTNVTNKPKMMLKLPRIAKTSPSPANISIAGNPIATGINSPSGTRSYWEIAFAKVFGSISFMKPA